MKKIITEELGYMKYLLGYTRGVVISEQTTPVGSKEKNVLAAYQLMINGASGMGTNPQQIVDGLNKIKDEYELKRLLTLFLDKKTEYDTFGGMIRGEFEPDNQDKLDRITYKLKSLGWPYSGYETIKEFKSPGFTPITTPLTDTPAAAPDAAAAVPESENKVNWEDVLKYYEGNKDPNWKFNEKDKAKVDGINYDYVAVNSTDTNDTDAYMYIYDDGDVSINNRGQGSGRSYGTWEWDGTKPVIKFKDISKNASGYVQPTDTDWSAVTENNKVIGLNAKGPLVKEVQSKLIEYGYSGTTSGSITTDVAGCLADIEKCDGIYGPTTKEMVKQYQKDNNGLSVDGIFGQQTYDAMFNA